MVFASDPVFCSEVSYESVLEDRGLVYANRAILEGVTSINRSCHPASHTVVPRAPFLTLMLLLERGNRGGLEEFQFADEAWSAEQFPGREWAGNESVDRMFRFLTIGDAMGREIYGNTWKAPGHISDRLAFRLKTVLMSNERLHRIYRDPLKLMDAIAQRDAMLQGDMK